MEGRFVFLGTGGSVGTPVIGCRCEVCTSDLSKNKRMRAGAFFETNGKKIQIDAGPDFRMQALQYSLDKLDGLILTHAHYDHIGGFDDAKIYHYRGDKLPCIMSLETFKEIQIRNDYLFHPSVHDPAESKFFACHILSHDFGKISFEGIDLSYGSFFQQGMKVLGLKIGSLAYISDIKEYDQRLLDFLKGVETLIVSASRFETTPAHFSVEEALLFAKTVGSKKTYLTHISHHLEHEKTEEKLPSGVFLAYDGLSLSFSC